MIWLLVVLIIAGCSGDPLVATTTNNPDFSVHLLFDHDGCRVYRFSDVGRYHYFVKCSNSAGAVNTRHEGKVNRSEWIPTED